MPPRQRYTGERYGWEEEDIELPFTLIDPLGNVVMGGVPGTNPVQMAPKGCRLSPREVKQYRNGGYNVVNVDPEVRDRKDLD